MLSERLLRLLTAYVDGEVSAHQRRVILRHLRRSAEARMLLKKLQNDAHQLRQLPMAKLEQDLSQKILNRIGEPVVRPVRLSVPQVPSPVPRGFGLATAAAVLLALGFGSYYYLTLVAEKDRHVAISTEPRENQLVDGSIKDPQELISAPELKPKEEAAKLAKADKRPETLPFPPKRDKPVPSAPPKQDIVASPVPVLPEGHFGVADIKLAMQISSRDLTLENQRLALLTRLHSDTAQHIDLYCKQTRPALDKLRKAFEFQGVHFVIAPDAAPGYLFDKKKQKEKDFVVFTENVKPEEIRDILHQVALGDRKAVQFGDLFVNGVTDADRKLLGKVLGVDPTQLQPPKPKTPLGVSIRRPVASGTADEVIRSVTGEGGMPRPGPGKATVTTPERLAVVATCNPVEVKPLSPEIQRFLQSRKDRQAGTMQMLLILRHQQ